MSEVVISYKGFNLDWTCHGFIYEVGQSYKHTGYQTGDRSAATVGKHSVAVAIGFEGRAKASVGGAICLVCRDDDGAILAIRATKIGENGTQPDVFYRLTRDGEFERAEGAQ